MNRMKQKPLGFTIVELMIVIIVIAILAAITIVAYTNIQNRARASATQSDLAQIERSFDIYYLDNNAFPSSIEEIREAGLGGMVDKITYAQSPDWRPDVERGEYVVYSSASASWDGTRTHYYSVKHWDYEEQQWTQYAIRYVDDGKRVDEDIINGHPPANYNAPCRTERLSECVAQEVY